MKSRTILLVIAAVMLLLLGLSLVVPEGGFRIGDKTLRYPSIRSIVSPKHEPSVEELMADSLVNREMNALADSLAHYRYMVDSSDIRFWLPAPDYLDDFWATLENARNASGPTRIMHYGDSQIEMDHITSRLRAYMQGHFGGGGPGMLPFHPITANPSVQQSTSGDLVHLASFGDSLTVRSRGDYGVMMQCFRLEGGSASTTLRPSHKAKADTNLRHYSRFSILYNNHSLKGTLGRGGSLDNAEPGIRSFTWKPFHDDPVKLHLTGQADIYCLMLDDDCGVAVDNIPMRGCSGQQFTLVDRDKLSQCYANLDVAMIIMQFGGNSVPYFKTSQQISTYCRSMGKQIDHVRQCCPGAKILFIGPSDMGKPRGGTYKTYDILPSLVDSLAATAVSHGVAYWSIYHAMGGNGSMAQWKREGLAGADFVHFSQRGADLMGDRLCEAFDNSYQLLQLTRRQALVEAEKAQAEKAAAQKATTSKSKAKAKGKRRKGGRR